MDRFKDLQDLTQVASKFKGDILEPFDPAYLSSEGYQIPEISSYEKKFYKKIGILQNKLRNAKVYAEWDSYQECFRVRKYLFESEYPTYRYVRVNMEENDYSFGTEEEDLVYDGRVSVVVEAVAKWVNSKIIKK